MNFYERYRFKGIEWSKRLTRRKVLDRLTRSLQGRGDFAVRHNHGEWKNLVSTAATIATVRDWLVNGPVGELVEVRSRKANQDRSVFIRRVEKRRIPKLPAQAKEHGWSKRSKAIWRWGMLWGAEWWGSDVRRKTRQGGSWSDHSWAGLAHDFGVGSNTKLGDKIERKLLKKFGPEDSDLLIVWKDNSLHFDHLHVRTGRRPGGTPPKEWT